MLRLIKEQKRVSPERAYVNILLSSDSNDAKLRCAKLYQEEIKDQSLILGHVASFLGAALTMIFIWVKSMIG